MKDRVSEFSLPSADERVSPPAPPSSFLGVLEPPPLRPLPPADPPPSSSHTLFIPRDPGPAPLSCPVRGRGGERGIGSQLTVTNTRRLSGAELTPL